MLLSLLSEGRERAMSYEDTWATAAEADAQITKHYEHWLALARGLHGCALISGQKSGA